MATTYKDWNDVPAWQEHLCRQFWSDPDSLNAKKGYRSSDRSSITVYSLKDYNVLKSERFLNDEQRLKLYHIALDKGLALDVFLSSLQFEPERIYVHDEAYDLPGIILGTWPHCNVFGGMDQNGYVHT